MCPTLLRSLQRLCSFHDQDNSLHPLHFNCIGIVATKYPAPHTATPPDQHDARGPDITTETAIHV